MTAEGFLSFLTDVRNLKSRPWERRYSGLTKTSTALPRLSSKRTIL
ncbi:AzlC family protein [Neisseria meningitidis]|nr:AzlC family protein [Neisseria meningitidis]RQL22685.1 AzlC family protein [Neisseria meningitidis]RQL30044.1 AzlC family protein [Neisseria meningitidis]RQL35770.1 AzlC family protein [Neisseria meningitidis]